MTLDKNTIGFKFKKNDRCFKEGDEISIDIIRGIPTYLVGPNGSGKTTLMHYIRAKKHTLFQTNRELHDGMTPNDDKLYEKQDIVEITGLDVYDNVFVLDSIDDDPTSFINSATAWGLVGGGGHAALTLSKGQKAKDMIGRFIQKITKATGFSSADYVAGKRYDKRSLIVIDEADEGLDIGGQMSFDKLMTNIATIFNADLICICHNPMCAFGSFLKEHSMVYDLSTRSMKMIRDYIKEQTGYEITVKKIDKENEKV